MTIRGGHEKNYQDFMDKIQKTDLKEAAKILNLGYSDEGVISISTNFILRIGV